MDNVPIIDSRNALLALCNHLMHCAWIALDTEFIRESTYFPRLCLLQVATPTTLVCIDPLSLDSLNPLLDLLYQEQITKVFHSAHQDLEIFYLLRGTPLSPVFDTQIGAALLGHRSQIGYAELVSQRLGVTLDKAHTRTDWSARPLTSVQIRYAADDVNYLRVLYQKLLPALAERGRLAWLGDECESLYDAHRFEISPDDAWQRVHGRHKLGSAQLAVLRHLTAWREREAQTQNRPRRWILSDAVLISLARGADQNKTAFDEAALARIKGLSQKRIQRFGDQIVQTICAGLNEPRARWPEPAARLQLSPEHKALVETMQTQVNQQAKLYNLHPEILATRRQLEKLVLGDRAVPVLNGWRAAVIGKSLEELLKAQSVSECQDNQ